MALKSVKVPKGYERIFAKAEAAVSSYFAERTDDPSTGTVEISGERYVLVRAAALSVEFFYLVRGLFGPGREEEADNFARNILFDLAHAIGRSDAQNFHAKMQLNDPIERLSAGPIHFSHTGWAFVDILPESHPSPDTDYHLIYDHPYSFEADAWVLAQRKPDFPACIMNAGYSSGWCEASFGMPLTACEILCRARGDSCCRFIMAPPGRIEEHVRRYGGENSRAAPQGRSYVIPDFFARKRAEEALRRAREDLEARVRERTADLAHANEALKAEVADRRRAEQALRDSQTKYRIVADNTDAWAFWLSPESEFLYSSPSSKRITGYEASEFVADPDLLRRIVHPDDQPRFDAHRHEVGSREVSEELEFRVVRPDGTQCWIAHICQPIFDEAGRFLGRRGSNRDITERKRAAELLRQERDKARNYLDIAGVILVAIDAGQRITLINKRGCEILRCTEDEVLGRNWFDSFIPESDRARTKAAFACLMAGRIKAVEYFENPVINRHGESRLIAWHNTLLRDATGAIVGTLSSGEDITDRKRAEEERERLNAQLREAHKLEAVGRFGRGVAHDFNNLMATVLGLASSMKSKRRSDHPDHAKLTQIEEAVETAAKLAHQLLQFAKGGKIRPHLLSFTNVVKSALILVPPMVPQNVTVDRQIESDSWTVKCDQTQIQQVIVNLCRNALEAMPNGGRLTIKTENVALVSPLNDAQPPLAAGEYACLTVEDTGGGMDAETMKRIFDPFFTTKKRGHGLGLAAAYGVMAAHGGAISVTSALGKGSALRLWLPRAKRPVKQSVSREH